MVYNYVLTTKILSKYYNTNKKISIKVDLISQKFGKINIYVYFCKQKVKK